MFDYGHGGRDSGAVYKGRLEKDDVLKLGRDVRKIIQAHGVLVDETRNKDEYVSLQARADKSNAKIYDYFISFHRNAFKPNKARGVETYTFTTRNPKAVTLANNINNAIAKIGFVNRGVKSANFMVLRETRAKAVLIEVGFIDNDHDNMMFDRNYDRIVDVIAGAILNTLGINFINKPTTNNTFYRVVTGSYNERINAEKQVERLKSKGFESFIEIFKK